MVVLRELVAHAENASVLLLEARGYSQGCLLEFLAVGRPAAGDDRPVLGLDFGSEVLHPDRPAAPADAGRALYRLTDEVAVLAGAVGRRIRLWVTPLPPAEGFVVATDWPARGIRGQRADVAGEAIRVAAWNSFPCLPA